MAPIRKILLAGTALTFLAGSAPAQEVDPAAPVAPEPLVEPVAPETATPAAPADAVAAAQQDVADARAALRKAMASGKGVREARQALARAVAALKQAQVAAGITPAGEDPAEVVETPPVEPAPPLAEAPPAEPTAPVAEAPVATPETEAPTATAPLEVTPETPTAEAPAAPEAEPVAPTGEAPPVKGPRPPRVVATPPAAPGTPAPTAEAPPGKVDDGRKIVNLGGKPVIRHDEDARFRAEGGRVAVTRGEGGQTVTTVRRPDGSQVITVKDADGNIVKRSRKLPNGKVVVLIDNQPAPPRKRDETVDFFRRLPPVVLRIPVGEYVVEARRATPRQIETALVAPPVEIVERPYTLEEIRLSNRLRDKVRRIDVDTVTFEFGQATIPADQVESLDAMGRALSAVIQRDPSQVFLIEGHTDAVGSDLSNLALSDRRAESVAETLTYYFDIPPENLVTQGYGEQYLKVPTELEERENRRVTVRNITPLLKADNG